MTMTSQRLRVGAGIFSLDLDARCLVKRVLSVGRRACAACHQRKRKQRSCSDRYELGCLHDDTLPYLLGAKPFVVRTGDVMHLMSTTITFIPNGRRLYIVKLKAQRFDDWSETGCTLPASDRFLPRVVRKGLHAACFGQVLVPSGPKRVACCLLRTGSCPELSEGVARCMLRTGSAWKRSEWENERPP